MKPAQPAILSDAAQEARERVILYLHAVGLPEEKVIELTNETMERLAESVDLDDKDRMREQAMDTLWSLLDARGISAEKIFKSRLQGKYQPPLRRYSIAYHEWNKNFKKISLGPSAEKVANDDSLWERSAALRRGICFLLVGTSTLFGSLSISILLGNQGTTMLERVIIVFFTILFTWTALNFWTFVAGFILLMRGFDLWNVRRILPTIPTEIPTGVKVAVVIPIYNEEVKEVFTNLQVMYESLAKTGQARHFHFFVLSDTNDPDKHVDEMTSWLELCRQLNGFGKIFYRHRRVRIGKKSGNIADFCRRWGSYYKYMIPLDSDSLISGQLMLNLVNMMEGRSDIGILQAFPKGIDHSSLFSRIQQFTSHLYGPLFLAGLHCWQLGDAAFWGHNAIIRMQPFMQFCALPKFAGRLPFGGEILSHDFVEAALMRRAGWGVWLAYDVDGGFEQLPSNILAENQRDRRWCQGNIQHLRLIFIKGLSLGHRVLFVMGNMIYFSSFLWLLLLILSTINAVVGFVLPPNYFPTGISLFPDWPVAHQNLSVALLWVTVGFFFLPKALSIIWLLFSTQDIKYFGGLFKLWGSIILETVGTFILVSIRMVLQSRCVVLSLLGKKVEWSAEHRSNRTIPFSTAFKAHGVSSLEALLWAGVAFYVNQGLFQCLAVILLPIIFSIPISQATSLPSIGNLFRRWGLFLTPVETAPSEELRRFQHLLQEKENNYAQMSLREAEFASAVVDPRINALFRFPSSSRRRFSVKIRQHRQDLLRKFVQQGAAVLTDGEKNILLHDSQSLLHLHQIIWKSPETSFHKYFSS